MYFRQLLNDETACASYLLGCKSKGKFAVVDPHVDLVDEYIARAEAQGAEIAAVVETHVQADHVSGLPELVARDRGDRLPARGRRRRVRAPCARRRRDGRSSATPSSRRSQRRAMRAPTTPTSSPTTPGSTTPGSSSPATRCSSATPAAPTSTRTASETVEEMARALYRSITERLLTLPDHLLLYPAHYSGSVCGRGLSGHPASTIGFERRHNTAVQFDSEDAFVEALVARHPAGAGAPGGDRRRQPRRPDRWPSGRSRGRGPARPAREPPAVLAPRRGQRLRRGDGRARALDSAADRRGRVRPHVQRRGALVHRRLRARQVADESRRGRRRRAARPPAAVDLRLARGAARAAADRDRPDLGLDRGRQRPARHQPGTRLVDDRRHEDRPRRPRASRVRAGPERGGRLRRGGRGRSR